MFTLDPHSNDFLKTVEFLLKLIAGIGGFYLFFTGLKRYAKDKIWRRNEFVAKEIKEFTSDKMARNAMAILDWGSRYVELFPGKANYSERFAKVDRQILKSALQYHKFKTQDPEKERFTEVEIAIRDSFDYFFSHFERFEHFIEAGLITQKELAPYLKYWVQTISEDIEDDVKNFIWHYLDKYEFRGTTMLFKRFNKNIDPVTDIESTRII